MNTQVLTKTLTGILITLAGIGALLDALNIFAFWEYFRTWWPLLLVLAGILMFINDRRQYITAIAFVIVGIVLQFNNLDLIEVNFWSIFWPVVIIAVGLSILLNRSGAKNIVTDGNNSVAAIFGGSETIDKSSDYKGGKATAIFGGVSIDLRDATIKQQATLEVFTLCGGVELKVPREWRIQQQVSPILGGIESKKHSEKADDKAPVLIITGTVALGGVEIHS